MQGWLLAVLVGAACGGSEVDVDPSGGESGGSAAASTGPDASSTSGLDTDTSHDTDGSTTSGASTGDETEGTTGVDVACQDVDSPLAPLPEFVRVEGAVRGSGVSLSFEPVPGARDYRVYTLPSADAVVADADGQHIEGAVYRCGGDRLAPSIPYSQNGFLTVDAQIAVEVQGYTRSETESTLGWVFLTDGPGRVPVYQLGAPQSDRDGACFAGHFAVTRVPSFTTDEAQRDAWIAAAYRDDGIAFWIPEDGSRTIYGSQDGLLFYGSDAEVAARGEGEPVFSIADDAVDDAVALRRFTIYPCGGAVHDVLAAGEPRFDRAFAQGNQPVWELEWPQLQPGEVLVVEALDQGCPFQGHLSARAVPPTGFAQAFVTPDEAAATSPYGELFVNGQHDPASNPQPIARSYVCLEPEGNDEMDVFFDFDTPMTFEETSLHTSGFWNLFLESEVLWASFETIEPDVWGLGTVMGELWVTYADWGADVNGRFRLTPKDKATVGADFVHATVEVDLWATGRRYPQLWLSTVDAPVQFNMDSGTTLNVQTFGGWPSAVEIQHCVNRTWDVNDQCPKFPLEHEPFADEPWAPRPPIGELSAPGMRSRIDLYASTDRAYVFIEDRPWACVEYPGLLPAGDVTVTYGDVLYHSGVDESVVLTDFMPYIRDHQLTESRRHVDNFGFRSGVEAPSWNHEVMPCLTELEG